MDFVSDAPADGRAFRCFNIADDMTRECVAIETAHSLPALRLIQVLNRLSATRGLPKRIVCDNGPEFSGHALDVWAHERGVALQFIRPGKPVENAFIESFNSSLRRECLSQHYFVSIEDASRALERWQDDYNNTRPHSSLGNVPPAHFGAGGHFTPARNQSEKLQIS